MKSIRIFLIILLKLLIVCNSFSQSRIDSLFNDLRNEKDDIKKLMIYNHLCREFSYTSSHNLIKYGKEALQIAEKHNNLKAIADFNDFIGQGYIDIFEYSKAAYYYQKSIQTNITLKKYDKIAIGCNNLGIIFSEKGYYKHAIKCYLLALKQYESTKYKLGIATCYHNIGTTYIHSNNILLGIKYLKKSFKYSINYNFIDLAASSLIDIGNAYTIQDKDSIALKYYEKALELNNELKNPQLSSCCYSNIGGIYARQEKYNQATKYLQEALKYDKETHNKKNMCIAGLLLADIYIKTVNINKAEQLALNSLKIAEETGLLKEIMQGAEILALIYSKKKNYEKAYNYHKYFKEINDSIYDIESNQQIKEIEARYENEKNEKEIITQKNKIELLEQKEITSRYKNIAINSIIILVLIGSVIVIINQKRKIHLNKKILETQRQLTEAEINNEKLRNNSLQKELEYRTKEAEYKSKEIEYKNKEIVNFALHLVEKNEFIDNLRKTIENAKDLINPKDLLRSIDDNSKNLEKEKQEFETDIENISQSFYLILKEKIPDISNKELRLASLLRLNLSSKEIAMILNLSYKSVETYRYNLRKKLNLTKSESLTDYLNTL